MNRAGHCVAPVQQAIHQISDNLTTFLRNKDASPRHYREPGLGLGSYNFFALWIVVSAWFVITGWILSICGALNLVGYSISTLILAVTLILGFRRVPAKFDVWLSVRRLGRRFRKPLPATFLVMACLGFIGGLLYAPNNYDYLTYRFPRLLHWVAEGRWHWIATNNERMNLSATGFEWLMAPLFVFTRSDRLFFLVNAISFVLLPGLVFTVLRSLGIRAKVAWQWMWLFPGGYCFVLQAGSVCNDSFAAVYLLAALAFGCQFKRTGRFSQFALSAIAAGLLTGAKASNIPLVLPIGVLWLSEIGRLLESRVKVLLTIVLAGAVSFLPMAVLNWVHAGNWTGDPIGGGDLRPASPVAGLAGNTLQLVVDTAQPPIFPFPNRWNEFAANAEQHNVVIHWIQSGFPRLDLSMRELVSDGAGIGVGVAFLWMLLVGIRILSLKAGSKKDKKRVLSPEILPWSIAGAGVFATLIYGMELASESGPRLLAPYYPIFLLIVLLFVGAHHPVRSRLWHAVTVVVAAIPIFLLVLVPDQPLFPVDGLLGLLKKVNAPNTLVQRTETVYRTYELRFDALAPIREMIPENVREIGFVGDGNQPEVSLWRPFGERRVYDLVELNNLRTAPRFIVASEAGIRDRLHESLGDWAKQQNLREVGRKALTTLVRNGVEAWALLEKQPETKI